MDTAALLEWLQNQLRSQDVLPWMSNYTEFGSFRESAPPSGTITLEEKGSWLWIKARLLYSGTTMDQTTDRLGGDPYRAQVAYDWVGPASSAPQKVTRPEELDEWAKLAVVYYCEYTDVGLWGVHQGRWVEDVAQDGIATVRVAKGSFQDVAPESTASTEEVILE